MARLYRMESRKEGVLDTLLTIYDALAAEARWTGDVAEQSAAGYNRLIALYDNWLFDEIIRQAPAILVFQSENGLWKNYYQTGAGNGLPQRVFLRAGRIRRTNHSGESGTGGQEAQNKSQTQRKFHAFRTFRRNKVGKKDDILK